MGRSQVVTDTSPSSIKTIRLEPARNCWRVARAKRAALIVDADDYCRAARQAMLAAREQIMLIGWDVDTRVALDTDKGESAAPVALGPLLS